MNKIYFISKKNRLEALMTISFKRKINWVEEGLSILSWEYYFIANSKIDDLKENYKKYRKWNGNEKTKKVGHNTMSIGDVIETQDGEAWIVIGSGWQKIPKIIWNKVNKF